MEKTTLYCSLNAPPIFSYFVYIDVYLFYKCILSGAVLFKNIVFVFSQIVFP